MTYIDRELLLQDISESVVFTVRNAETSPELRGAKKVIDRIRNAPTADVVEVVKVAEMLCKIKNNIIKNVCTMIENDFNKIVKDALEERRDT